MYSEVKAQNHKFLISALEGSEYSAPSFGRLTPRERTFDTYFMKGLLRIRIGLKVVPKTHVPAPAEDRTAAFHLVANHRY
jgi:hypothetical protein